jgi:hypothetical protein
VGARSIQARFRRSQEDLLGLLDLAKNADTGVAVQLGESIIQE